VAATLALPDRVSLHLDDGRRLGVRTWGDPAGIPVLYCHGSPSSSAEARLFGRSDQMARAGVRLIAPDRPGAGGSSFQRGRRISDWGRDVAELMDRLEVERFAVLGYSGGGPYALAIATEMADRLTAVTTVSGTGPFDVPGVTDDINPQSLGFMRMATSRPLASRAASWGMGLIAGLAPGRMVAQARAALPPPDAAAMDDPEIGAAFARMVHETTHGSARGAQHDTALMVSPWGFDPADVAVPVRMWHGTEDRNAPPAMARYLEATLPAATLTWLEGEGHVSAAANHAPEILADLAGRAGGAGSRK
jgi:pimeloyl-ACP methyl ester carboxylesterase